MNKQTPFVVGLTGGRGSGKSAATDIFASLGIDIVDADEVIRMWLPWAHKGYFK